MTFKFRQLNMGGGYLQQCCNLGGYLFGPVLTSGLTCELEQPELRSPSLRTRIFSYSRVARPSRCFADRPEQRGRVRYAEFGSSELGVESVVDSVTLEPMEMLSGTVFARVRKGLIESRHTAPMVTKFFASVKQDPLHQNRNPSRPCRIRATH